MAEKLAFLAKARVYLNVLTLSNRSFTFVSFLFRDSLAVPRIIILGIKFTILLSKNVLTLKNVDLLQMSNLKEKNQSVLYNRF